jgi:Ca-activated chloride channel homolog
MWASNIILAHPWWLLLLLALPIIYFLNRKNNYKQGLYINNIGTLKYKQGYKVALLKALPLLKYLGLIFLIIAMARPQAVKSFTNNDGEGIDIMMSIDISGSMLAEDFLPNRLESTKKVAAEFINMRPNDKIGLTIFSGESFLQCPLTGDHQVLLNQVNMLQCGMLADGTAIGMGLATAVDHLQTSKTKSKIVILLTDGVNNSGLIDPNTALEIAKSLKIKVYTIGVGTNGNARMPIGKDPFDNWVFSDEKVEIDEALLKQIAAETGGKYYRSTENNSLKNIYKQIDILEKSKVTTKSQQQYRELYERFIWVGFMLWVIAIILEYTWLKSFPA